MIEQINFGNKVATAGDVNGDGYSDVIVSEFNFRNSYDKKEKGRIFVF
ncbi:MAG: FG-GAP repeat protein [Ignavibacteria bacterium]|nr:FG-GAP repeat protein [Ignavibacteria bacterium]